VKNGKRMISEGIFTVVMLVTAFGVNLFLQEIFATRALIPMIFVLAVFLVSWVTQGYFWGITASLISVLAVNYAFTYPYYAFDLISPECIASAVVMLIVSTITGTMTTKLKRQEKMRAEAETERMRGNLLRAVSHDLRTPLTSIYGACSVLSESYDELSREQHMKLLSEVRADAQWLVRMVENLLSVTRIDADRVRVSKHETVLEELVDAVLLKFHKHYPTQAVEVRIPEEFISIPMDPMLIEQVIINLLENAVFHAEGMRNLCLEVATKGNRAVFRVIDDGCGIDPEKMDKLFTGFPDAKPVADSSRSSMGIGLSVCSTIIKAHNGEIWADNLPSGGACISFSLEMEEKSNEQQ